MCACGGAAAAFSTLPNDFSIGKVYFFSQSSSVEEPKMPAFGYCEAWICVSIIFFFLSDATRLKTRGGKKGIKPTDKAREKE